MNFCSHCGGNVQLTIPDGDSRARYVCQNCNFIHYQNPNIVAGTLPIFQGKVLLCKRAIEPRKGLWTLPAGFMENGEAVDDAARRETREEACAHTEDISLYTVTSIVHVNQVQLLYLANLEKPEFAVGEETLDVQLFSENEIPWEQLAFETIANALRFYFQDRLTGTYPVRHITITGK